MVQLGLELAGRPAVRAVQVLSAMVVPSGAGAQNSAGVAVTVNATRTLLMKLRNTRGGGGRGDTGALGGGRRALGGGRAATCFGGLVEGRGRGALGGGWDGARLGEGGLGGGGLRGMGNKEWWWWW